MRVSTHAVTFDRFVSSNYIHPATLLSGGLLVKDCGELAGAVELLRVRDPYTSHVVAC